MQLIRFVVTLRRKQQTNLRPALRNIFTRNVFPNRLKVTYCSQLVYAVNVVSADSNESKAWLYSSVRYCRFKHAIMPTSIGCKTDVGFAGRNATQTAWLVDTHQTRVLKSYPSIVAYNTQKFWICSHQIVYAMRKQLYRHRFFFPIPLVKAELRPRFFPKTSRSLCVSNYLQR